MYTACVTGRSAPFDRRSVPVWTLTIQRFFRILERVHENPRRTLHGSMLAAHFGTESSVHWNSASVLRSVSATPQARGKPTAVQDNTSATI
jgi:hypothetical protein